jgi:CBS domain-containing protein
MNTVNQLLKTKGQEIWSVKPHTTVYEALQVMSEKDIGALLVIEDGRLEGIFSERDYARKLILKGKGSKATNVDELMTREVITVEPATSFDKCMALMTTKRIRHLPVTENDKVVGLVTMGDVVKQIILNQESTIEQLGNYISGGY